LVNADTPSKLLSSETNKGFYNKLEREVPE